MRSIATFLCAGVLLAAAPPDGDRAPDFTLPDLEGKGVALASLKDRKAVVLLFTGIQCPRGRAAEPRLGDMAKKYGEKGVAFLAINSNRNESPAEIADHVKKSAFAIPVLKDEKGRVAALYKVEVQPTAVLLDATGAVRYRGLIDDHKNEEFVRTHHLRDALEAVLEGREVAVKSTEPEGCAVRGSDPAAASKDVTYSKHVAPILNKHCLSCHRTGQVGPFSIDGYEQASAWSREIMLYTKRKSMPPWKPLSNHGEYYNERRLTDGELATLESWHRNGAPEGDPKDLPAKPVFPTEWAMGTPDAVLKVGSGWIVASRGPDEYRCYVLQNPFDEDKWISTVEYRPGNLRAVHHILAFLDRSAQGEKKDAADPDPGYKSNGSGPGILPSGSLGGWAPGNLPRRLPEGTGRLLRKGERIILETHYHKTGRPEKDEGHQLAIYFSREPVKKMINYHMILNPMLGIPAGAEAHRVAANWTVPHDLHALDVMPHMHLLGKEMSVVATFPDGTKKDLVVVKDWDFNWQETYQFKEPLALPKGTKVRVEAFYDNSEKNRNNPSNPPKRVTWGEETTDEMCIAFVGFTLDTEDRTKPKDEEKK